MKIPFTFNKDATELNSIEVLLKIIKDLMHLGDYIYISNAFVVNSMRRYERNGFLKTMFFWLWTFLISQFKDVKGKNYEEIR